MIFVPRLIASLVIVAGATIPMSASSQTNPFNDTLLTKARAAATMVPGDLPVDLRYLKFASGGGKLSQIIETTSDSAITGALTVFQIRYPRGWIMVDAGMAKDVNPKYAFVPGGLERVRQALSGARLIVVTHEHDDHAAEVLRAPMADSVAGKTVLTRAQVQTLIDKPITPLIQLTPARARNYIVVDYDVLYPLAPGVVLLKAAGHTPGSQMVYARTASGKEFLLIGDIAWLMAGIERRLQKPPETSANLGEDRQALRQQIEWLSGLTQRQQIVLVNCHDDAWLRHLVAVGLLKDDLDLTAP